MGFVVVPIDDGLAVAVPTPEGGTKLVYLVGEPNQRRPVGSQDLSVEDIQRSGIGDMRAVDLGLQHRSVARNRVLLLLAAFGAVVALVIKHLQAKQGRAPSKLLRGAEWATHVVDLSAENPMDLVPVNLHAK